MSRYRHIISDEKRFRDEMRILAQHGSLREFIEAYAAAYNYGCPHQIPTIINVLKEHGRDLEIRSIASLMLLDYNHHFDNHRHPVLELVDDEMMADVVEGLGEERYAKCCANTKSVIVHGRLEAGKARVRDRKREKIAAKVEASRARMARSAMIEAAKLTSSRVNGYVQSGADVKVEKEYSGMRKKPTLMQAKINAVMKKTHEAAAPPSRVGKLFNAAKGRFVGTGADAGDDKVREFDRMATQFLCQDDDVVPVRTSVHVKEYNGMRKKPTLMQAKIDSLMKKTHETAAPTSRVGKLFNAAKGRFVGTGANAGGDKVREFDRMATQFLCQDDDASVPIRTSAHADDVDYDALAYKFVHGEDPPPVRPAPAEVDYDELAYKFVHGEDSSAAVEDDDMDAVVAERNEYFGDSDPVAKLIADRREQFANPMLERTKSFKVEKDVMDEDEDSFEAQLKALGIDDGLDEEASGAGDLADFGLDDI